MRPFFKRPQDYKTTSCWSDVVMLFFHRKKQFREVSCGFVDDIFSECSDVVFSHTSVCLYASSNIM